MGTTHPLTAAGVAVALGFTLTPAAQRVVASGMPREGTASLQSARDPSWSPSSTHLALTLLDQIWVMTREGQAPRAVAEWPAGTSAIERDPAWSPDGRRIAFAADRGEGFDLFVVASSGGEPQRLTFLQGDERWPSWTPNGYLVFASHTDRQWDLFRVASVPPSGVVPLPERLTSTAYDETEPHVSPDGGTVLYVSTHGALAGDTDLWLLPLAFDTSLAAGGGPVQGTPVRVIQGAGREWSPTWSPDGRRVAFGAIRNGAASLWVASLDTTPRDATDDPPGPIDPPVLISRRGGEVAWAPDGRVLLVTDTAEPQPSYNGEPRRDAGHAVAAFAPGPRSHIRLLPAPAAPDETETSIAPRLSLVARFLPAFDRVWSTLHTLYYSQGPGHDTWQALRNEYRPAAAAARDEASLESVVDAMVQQQPLVLEPVRSNRAVVVSGHRLASQAGAEVIERGGNVVDAAIAVSFTLGVVEPDGSGLGGDGMALVLLKGMREPAVIDFKDQSPTLATIDNATILRDGSLVTDGPASVNVPGLVAGLDLLRSRFGSGLVPWADLVAPAIRHAEEGFVLDAALPTTIAHAQSVLARYDATRAIFMPGGRVPRPGDRFTNHGYARTLQEIATRGAETFYRGEIAKRIADDMAEHGGLIRYEDLAQYRAIERQPVSGRFRNHLIFSTPPPVASGTSLVEALQILDHEPAAGRRRSQREADYLHMMLEAWKVRHPMSRIADPALWSVDVTPHLDYAHAGMLFAQIDRQKASALRPEAREPAPDTDVDSAAGLGRGTTAFVVADTEGNVIAVTQTLSTWGGSFYVSKGLGFLYNNHLASSRVRRGAYGQLQPLTRSSTTNAPTIVVRDQGGERVPTLAVGAAGNAWILASIYTIIDAVLSGGMSAQAAVEAPRFLVARDPADRSGTTARVQIEDRFPRDALENLERRGHVFRRIGRKGELRYGYASAVVIDVDRRVVEGGADPRRSHAAVAAR